MRKIIITGLLLAATFSSISQPMASKAIDELAERTLVAFDVPGIAVAIVKDGKVIHSKGYGVSSLDTKRKTDANTLFGIASNSKAFTAVAIGILVDEGKIKWDDKVRTYIPEFKMYDAYVTEEFTIRDLLTHRSGLGLGAGDLMLFPDSNDFTIKDVIYNLRYLKPVSGFRTKFDYDNNLYVIAGEVVARVTGKSWDAFVEQRIFRPLGMSRSAGGYKRLKDATNVIDGHAPVDGKVQVIGRDELNTGHSAGGIYSSVNDLSKWVLLQLAHGKYGDRNTKQLINTETLDELWTPQTIIPSHNPGPYNTHFTAYGLGFFISDVKGYKQLMHTGGLEGMVTQITMIPEINLGIIVLTNQQEGGAFTAITNQIKDSYLGVTGTDRVAEYSKRRKGALDNDRKLTDSVWHIVAEARQQTINIATYTGTYKDQWFGEVVISVKKGKLWFESKRSHKLSGEMCYYKGNTFAVRWNDRSMDADAFVNFSLDENGRGTGITMKAISPLTDFSFDFQDLDLKRVE